MKKFNFYVFFGVVLVLFPALCAHAEMSLSGELDVLAQMQQLPTRDQGKTAFSIPSLKLFVDAPLRDDNGIFLELETAEKRDGTSGRYDTQLKQAYLTLTSFLPKNQEMRYGLVPNPWIDVEEEDWDYTFWGVSSYVPMERYGYLSPSDLGLSYRGELGGDWGEWIFSLTNGEGVGSDEIGPRKEAQLLLRLTKGSPFVVTLGYVYGNYENMDPSFNRKNRALLRMSYQSEKSYLGLEFFQTEDAADAMTAGGIANGVDVAALAGTVVRGLGGSLFGTLSLDTKWNLFLRGDYLQPVQTAKSKVLQTLQFGTSYDVNDDLRAALAFYYNAYTKDYAPGKNNESGFLVATRVNF